MKKEYKNPEMEFLQFESEQMLALSKGEEYSGGKVFAPRYGQEPDENGQYDNDDEEDW